MFNFQSMLDQMLRSQPGIAQNPIAQNYINVIRSGDSQRGQQIAQNLLKTYGISKEEALAQARQILHMP